MQIQIALPVPPHEVDDPLRWARSVLPKEFREMAVSAEEMELCVLGIRADGEATLTTHLGCIVDPDTDDYLQCVPAIVATLRPDYCRHVNDRVQWPLQVVHRGRTRPDERRVARGQRRESE